MWGATAANIKMKLARSVYLLLVCSVVFSGGGLAAAEEDEDGSYHVNSWVVEVHAGEGHAARLADRHGFINRGQVRVAKVGVSDVSTFILSPNILYPRVN